jgi:hypothetical protein
MRLSEELQQMHDSGDFGKALEGCAQRAKQLEHWLKWCMDNCDDSPEYNFGTDATDILNRLLKGESVCLPDNLA